MIDQVKIKVAIADDSQVFRKGFLAVMKAEVDFDFIIEATNGADLINKLEEATPDVVLMDLRMPVMDGIEATKRIMRDYPAIKIIAFTQFDMEKNIIEMSKLGVKSFVGKDEAHEIPKVIRIVHHGGAYFPDKIAEIISKYLGRNALPAMPPFKLSNAEQTLLQGLAKGLNSSKLADILCKSPRTIEKNRLDFLPVVGVFTDHFCSAAFFLHSLGYESWS